MARPEKIRLGDMLIQQDLISAEQLKFALEEQKRSGRKLGRILVESGASASQSRRMRLLSCCRIVTRRSGQFID